MKKLTEVAIVISVFIPLLFMATYAFGAVVILNEKLQKGDRFGLTSVLGQVKNTGNDTISDIEIGLTGYDNDGNVIVFQTTFPESTTLPPNQTSAFYILEYTSKVEGMINYDLSLKWTNSSGQETFIGKARPLQNYNISLKYFED